MQRIFLAIVLGAALAACDRQEASVNIAASTNPPASNTEGSSLALGTAVDSETEKDILQLDAEENEASGKGDTEGMIDRMLADDTLLINATGRIVTTSTHGEYSHEFQKDPKRAATAPRPRHDEFWMRRFGDVVVSSGRSTTVKADASFGPMRRYIAVVAKRRGQWFVLGRQVVPIDHKRPPDSPEVLAVMARAHSSPTNTIVLGAEPEPDLREQINKLAVAQNDANFIGDGEHLMRDHLLADDILWVSPTGHVQTKTEYLANVRAAFEKNPNRKANGLVNKHDDFTVRRFGDVVIQLGRSTTINPDLSPGPQRRYMNVFLNRRGQWWLIAHAPTPIVS